MKYVFILFLILTACGKEDSVSLEKSCEGIYTSTCETDGTKCYDDCGRKIKLIACYKIQDDLYNVHTTTYHVNDISYCDLTVKKKDDGYFYISEVFPPFKKENCMMWVNTPSCKLQ